MTKVTELIAQVSNPVTGASLEAEKRIISVEFKGEDLYIKYKRDGISPDVKKSLESAMLTALEGEVSEDQVYILSESTNSEDVMRSVGEEPQVNAKPAELKVGHGAIGEKKKIDGVKHILAIGSGKGGVGKSTFTSNLAISLSKQGYKVGVIDADIYGPSLPVMFDKREHRPQSDENKKIIPIAAYGIKFISFGNFIHEDEPVVWRGPMLGGVLNQFLFDTAWGELDYLLLDLPPGTGDIQLSMIQNVVVDGAIIISTPQDIALLDARKALHMFDKMGLHVVGMVENMSSFVCDGCGKEHYLYGTGGVTTACNDLGVGYLGKIPMDLELRKSCDFGTPYMSNTEKHAGQKVWNSYGEITKKVDSFFNPDEVKKKGILSKIFNKH